MSKITAGSVQIVEQELLGLNTNIKDLKSIKEGLLQIRIDINTTLEERHLVWQGYCKKYNRDPSQPLEKLGGATLTTEEKKDFEQIKKQFKEQNTTISSKVSEFKQQAKEITGLSDNQVNKIAKLAKTASKEAKSASLKAENEAEILD